MYIIDNDILYNMMYMMYMYFPIMYLSGSPLSTGFA